MRNKSASTTHRVKATLDKEDILELVEGQGAGYEFPSDSVVLVIIRNGEGNDLECVMMDDDTEKSVDIVISYEE